MIYIFVFIKPPFPINLYFCWVLIFFKAAKNNFHLELGSKVKSALKCVVFSELATSNPKCKNFKC